MRTEYDLRAAIDELAQDAPDVEHVLPPVARPRRLQLLAPIAVAAAVVATVTAVAILTGTDGTHRQVTGTGTPHQVATFAHPCATTSAPDLQTLTIRPVEGLAQKPVTETSCAGYRQRWLYDANGGWVGAVTVFAPGVFDASLTDHARQVSGHGITGYEVTVPGATALGVVPCPVDPRTLKCADVSGLAWRYGDDAWGFVNALAGDPTTRLFGKDPSAKELEIAAAVAPAEATPVLLPFTIMSLPAGTHPVKAQVSDGSGDLGLGVVGQSGCPAQTACSEQLSITVDASASSDFPQAPGRRLTINDHAAYLTTPTSDDPDPTLRIATGTWTAVLTSTTSRLTGADLVDVAKHMRFAASTTDRSTWFAAP